MIGVMSSVLELEYLSNSNKNEREAVDAISPLYSLAKNRRAIKYFSSSHTISENIMARIIESACFAPSAFNLQHWRVTRVTDIAVRREIYSLAWFQSQVINASELLVIYFDKNAWARSDILEINFPDEDARGIAAHRYAQLYANNPQLARDEGMRSSAMFSMLLMLAAKEFGLDTCPMTGFDAEKVNRLLEIDDQSEICMLIAVGVPSSENRIQERPRLPIHSILKTL